jgi:Ca2+-binding RTX toxin-like protein
MHTLTSPRRSTVARITLAIAAAVAVVGISAAQASAEPSVKAKLHHGALEIRGTKGDDKITLRLQAGQPGTLQVDVGDDGSADFSFDRASVASIDVRAGAGNDVVRIDEGNGAFSDTIPTTLRGGSGNDELIGGSGAVRLFGGSGGDKLLGGNGNELLVGGSGDDVADGNRGADTALMGSGDDTFGWDPGDGSDVVEGQNGADTMVFNGAAAAEKIDLSANGNRLKLFRDVGSITMDTAGVETVDVNPLGGPDQVTVGDLARTQVRAVVVDLAGALEGDFSHGDGQPDRLVVAGTDRNDSIDVSGDASEIKVGGLAATVSALHTDGPIDRLEINTGAGKDVVDTAGLVAGAIQLFVNGVLVP